MVACLGDEARYAVCWGSGDLVFLFPDVRWDKQESGFDLLMLFGACCSGPFFLSLLLDDLHCFPVVFLRFSQHRGVLVRGMFSFICLRGVFLSFYC